jgi:hypothetical protein
MRDAQLKCNYEKFIWSSYHYYIFSMGLGARPEATNPLAFDKYIETASLLTMSCFKLFEIAK